MAKGRIKLGVDLELNKTSLASLRDALNEVQVAAQKASFQGELTNDLKAASQEAKKLSNIITQSWDMRLNQLNLSKFNDAIKSNYKTVEQLKTSLARGGEVGVNAYNKIASAAITTNIQIKKSSKLLDDMATSFSNTVKWGISSSVFNSLTSSLSQAYGYVKNLDKSLNDIRIVTNASADEMERFAVQANKAAKGLGASTKEFADAALIYYQQGDTDAVARAKAEVTLKTANVTGQNADEVSEQLTAVWNGYKVDAAEAELYIDKLAAVAATTAADLEELSTGMSKVASAANIMGVDIDQLNAQLATIVSVTRQAPESVGTALKTIYARMGDIEAGLDTETTLGNYTAEMEAMGFNVLNANGQLRDMGEVIEEIGSKWTTLSREQQIALSQTVAGTRQYNNLLSLFDNWDMYTKAMETSANAAGTLQEQQDIYMESVEAHLQTLSTEAEKTWSTVFDTEVITTFADVATKALSGVNAYLQGLGGGMSTVATLGGQLVTLFSKQIGNSLQKQLANHRAEIENARNVLIKDTFANAGSANTQEGAGTATSKALDEQLQYYEKIKAVRKELNEEEAQELNTSLQAIGQLKERIEFAKNYQEIATKAGAKDTSEAGIKKSINIQDEHVRRLTETKDKYIKAFEEMSKEVEENNETMWPTEEMREFFKEALAYRKEFIESEDLAPEMAQQYKEETEKIEELSKRLDQGPTAVTAKEVHLAVKGYSQEIAEAQDNAYNLRGALQGCKEETNGTRLENEALLASEESLIIAKTKEKEEQKEIKEFVEGASIAYTSLMSIAGSVQTLFDPDLSGWEKFTSILAVIGTQFVTIITHLDSIKSFIPNLKAFVEGFTQAFARTATEVASNKIVKKSVEEVDQAYENLNQTKGVEGTAATTTKLANDSAEIASNLAVKASQTAGKAGGTVTSAASGMASGATGATGATIASGTATSATSAAAGTGAAGLGASLGSVAAAAAPVLAVLIAIAAIAGAVYLGWTQQARAAEEAAEKAQELSQEYNKVKEESEKVKESINSFRENASAFEELSKDAANYEESLKSLNEQALELIEKHKLFNQYKIVDGQIKIDEEALSDIENQADQNVITARNQAAGAQIYANELQMQSDASDLGRSLGYSAEKFAKNSWDELVASMVPGGSMVHNATADSEDSFWSGESILENVLGLIPGLATIPNLINNEDQYRTFSNEDIDSVAAAMNSLRESEEDYEALLAEGGDAFKEALLNTGQLSETAVANIDAVMDKREDMEAYAESVKAATEANEYYAKQLLSGMIQEKYGEDFKKMATDEDGNVDKNLVTQLETAATNKASKIDDELQQKLKDAEDEIADVKSNADLRKIEGYEDIDDDKDLAKRYATEIKGLKESEITVKDGWGKSTIKDKSTGEVLLDEVNDVDMRQALARKAKQDEIIEQFEKDNSTNLDSYKNTLNDLVTGSNALGKEYGTDFSMSLMNSVANDQDEIDLSSNFKDMSATEKEELEDLESDELLNKLGLTEDQIKELGWENAEKFEEEFDNALAEYDIGPYLENLQGKIETTSGLIDTLFNGDELSDEQLEKVKELEKEYDNLSAIQDKNSKEYLAALMEINQALETEAIETAQVGASELIEEGLELDVNADTSKAADKLKEIAEADYKVLVAVEADIQSDFDEAVNSMSSIEDMASKIGDDFIIAAEDIEELNDTFPGILDGMTILSDGTAQLSQEAVNNAMAGAQAEVQADTQKTVEKLKNQQAELAAKADAAQAVADLAGQMIGSEKMTTEQEAALDAALSTLKQDNSETTAQNEQENQKYVADASKENSEAMATNFSGAYQKMAEDSKKWADAAKTNMLVATTGQGTTTSGGIKVNYTAKKSGKDVKTAEKGEIKDSSSINETTDWAAVQEYYSNLAQNYRDAANNTQGKIAELLARNSNFNKKTTGVGKGLGSDGKRDKSGSEKEAEYVDLLEDEKDLYHDVNIELKEIANELDVLNKKKEKVFGKALIENINEQLKLLEKQTNKLNEKLDIAGTEAVDLGATLSAQGVKFDADGSIANYSEAYNAQLAYVNGIIAQYNSMSAEAQEGFKDTVDQVQEDFDKFVNDLKKYDDLITDIIPGLQSEIEDTLNEQITLQVESFNMEIELRLNLNQATKDWNSFRREIIEGLESDDILSNAKASLEDFSSYYNDAATGIIEVGAKHVNNILTEIAKIDAGDYTGKYGDNKQLALDELQKYYTELMSQMRDVDALMDAIHQSRLDMMDEAAEKFEEQISSFETIGDLIEHDKNMISLIYGDEAYSELAQFYDKQKENNLQQLDFQRQQVAFWKEQMDAAEENSDEWEKAKENWISATTELNSKIEASVENLKDSYVNAINEIFQSVNNQVTGGKGLAYMSEEWDLINRNADMYLDSLDALYQMQEVENKYLDAIDNTDSLSSQRQLNNLMEQELQLLKDKDKLTQYDIERANTRYEIALKQIALQEAQQNKSSMRLRRDSQGNYSYQYVADDDAVSKAQQELTDLYNQLYNLDKDKYRDNLNEIYSVWDEFQQKMAEAAQINDPVQREERELLIREQYGELINNLVAQNETIKNNLYQSSFSHLFDLYDNNQEIYATMTDNQRTIIESFLTDEVNLNTAAFDNLFGLYNANLTQFATMTELQKDMWMGDLIPSWSSGVQEMTDRLAGPDGFNAICNQIFQELAEAMKAYEQSFADTEEAAGRTAEEIKSGYNEAITEVQSFLSVNQELIAEYQKQLEETDKIISNLETMAEKYAEIKTQAEAATKAAYEYWAEQQRQAAEEAKKNQETEPEPEEETNQGTGGDTGGTTPQTQPVNTPPSLTRGTYVDVKPGTKWYHTSRGATPWGWAKGGHIKYLATFNPYGYNIDGLGWIKKTDIVGYASGGYTGDWSGEDGRLAMLHKKEIILNKADTVNLLNAVEIIRDITSNLGQSMLSKLGAITAGNIAQANGVGDILEQNVHIDAQFPNVTNSKEIENAINNLMNVATQRIGRR